MLPAKLKRLVSAYAIATPDHEPHLSNYPASREIEAIADYLAIQSSLVSVERFLRGIDSTFQRTRALHMDAHTVTVQSHKNLKACTAFMQNRLLQRDIRSVLSSSGDSTQCLQSGLPLPDRAAAAGRGFPRWFPSNRVRELPAGCPPLCGTSADSDSSTDSAWPHPE